MHTHTIGRGITSLNIEYGGSHYHVYRNHKSSLSSNSEHSHTHKFNGHETSNAIQERSGDDKQNTEVIGNTTITRKTDKFRIPRQF